ncbi:MAG: aminotransferase class V-fold PLP-dependent enzyme [Bacteroidota bacterium]
MSTKAATQTEGQHVDFDRLRADFPVLDREINGQALVYLDNAASSQMPKVVADRIHQYHTQEHANVHRGVHTLSQEATDAYELARSRVQEFINAAKQHEILYTTGTTDSINLVAQSLGSLLLSEGDVVLLSEMEHHANIVPWQMLGERTGATIRRIPINESGELILDELEVLLDDVKIVSVAHVSNALGTINPVKKIIDAAHQRDIPVVLDGAQSAPHMPVDVQALDCDFYAFSAHKMCGPTGFGILYGKEKWLDKMPPYRGGGEMIDKVTFEKTTYNVLPHKFEAGTPPIAAGVGFAATIEYLQAIGMDAIYQREHELLQYATQKLKQVEGLHIIGEAKQKAGVISFVMDQAHPHDIGTILDQQGIAIRTGHHCAQPVMQRYDIPATARASLYFYNNKTDVDRLIEGLGMIDELFG